jgi:hypothetical protein
MFAELNLKPDPKKDRKTSSKKAGMRKLGNLGAHRGNRGAYVKKDSR